MPDRSTSNSSITFLVPGETARPASGRSSGTTTATAALGLAGTVKAAIRVAQQRGPRDEQRVSAEPGHDVVVLHLENGPPLVLHPLTARDLMLAQAGTARESSRSARSSAQDEGGPNEVRVSGELRWTGLERSASSARGATRGFLGDVILKVFEVVTLPLRKKAEALALDTLINLVDGQVKEAVYRLTQQLPEQLKGLTPTKTIALQAGTKRALVFIHGTFSDTVGTFGKLWQRHPDLVGTLFNAYGDQVFGLDHATLGKSPIDNALTLAKACPDGARLHLVTHSRGGLVAEVLARAAGLKRLDRAAGELYRFNKLPSADAASKPGTAGRREIELWLAGQLKTLSSLVELLADRDIKVERVVRIACPARGTLLASKRFDAYLSVFRWGLDLAQIPVLPKLVEFLGEVARQRTDPTLFPGLAAMVPDSPLVQWLHNAQEPVPGELRVVAGDLEGDSVGSWLKTLMADAFYWTDNDLVVQTRSMYGGTPRAAGASFVLDRGAKVSHFAYFSNERTARAIVSGLTQELPGSWRTIGPLSYAGESASGARAAMRRNRRPDGTTEPNKPAVFVLPGILGSHIKVDGKRVWLSFRLLGGLTQLEYKSADDDRFSPDGVVGKIYDDLIEFLGQSHEVVEFSYDWRKPIEEEARRLGKRIAGALSARSGSGKPVRMIAHSMGGLVARTMQLECPDVWQQMMLQPGGRLLMLGTPNGGSWAPMQTLSGDDTFGNTLIAFGAPFQDHKARQMMAQFPGFIQLQAALNDPKHQLDRHDTWRKLAEDDLAIVREHNWWHADIRQLTPYEWGVPTQEVLDAAVALRRRLDEQRDSLAREHPERLLLVAGMAKFTPDGFEIGNEGLTYLNAREGGDGRVTLDSAILPNVATWRVDCEHGALPDERGAFEAYLELLEHGRTERLRRIGTTGATRSGGTPALLEHVRSRPARERPLPRPPETPDEIRLLDVDESPAGHVELSTPLRVSVVNGDLRFVRQPLVFGHYSANLLSGAEWVVNQLIGGTMAQSLKLGQYPDLPGTHQLFANRKINRDNPFQAPRPEAVLVVGLGEEGKLEPSHLALTVKLGVLALGQRLLEQGDGAPRNFEIAATLLGSGGSNVTAAKAAQFVAQGVRDADIALRELNEAIDGSVPRWPRIESLQLIELYLNRATEAWQALALQAAAAPTHFQLEPFVGSAPGGLRRPLDDGYRGSSYDFIRAISSRGQRRESTIEYTVHTRRARSEVRAQSTQAGLVRELVESAATDHSRDTGIGRTLFHLLVPIDLEPMLGGTSEMLLELDHGTAGIPWELLDTPAGSVDGDGRPWAIRSKLIRKLRINDFRHSVSDARSEAHVLIVGEPQCDPRRYPRLPGARREAKAVHRLLSSPQALGEDQVIALISPDNSSRKGPGALEIINTLMDRRHDWRIVHVAGHGEPPRPLSPYDSPAANPQPSEVDPRGVVLSNGTYLGPREIHNMRTVPELVFVNCCFLAARDIGQLLTTDDRPNLNRAEFASGVAEELIKIGVRCVVAAGWAVDDEPAACFATTFYRALLRGERFMDAIAQAREAAWELGGNTWAAYQCYGDPDWVFRREATGHKRSSTPPADEFAGITSAQALVLTLDTLAVESHVQGARREHQQLRIRYLAGHFGERFGTAGNVAEAFAAAWESAGGREEAITWYRRAIASNDGSASLKASEQLGSLLIKQAWSKVEIACREVHRLRRAQSGRTDRREFARQAKAAEKAREIAIAQAHIALDEAIGTLSKLNALHPTQERLSLLGAALKRRAMIHREEGKASKEALEAMLGFYTKAEATGRQAGTADFFYPAMNRLAAQLALASDEAKALILDPRAVSAIRQALTELSRNAPDFWNVVGLIELRGYEALAEQRLSNALPELLADYADLAGRMPGTPNWGSVLDQLRFLLYHLLLPGGKASAERAAAGKLVAAIEGFANAHA